MNRSILALCALYAVLYAGCADKYKGLAIGYRTVALARDTASDADRAVAAWMLQTHERCAATHKPKTTGYVDCSAAALQLHERWKIGRTAVQSAIHATVGALRAYHAALDRGERPKGLEWLLLAKPLVCGLARAVRSLGPYIKKPDVGAVLALAEGVSCVD